MKKIINVQFFVLLVGTIFAWSNFILELFAWLNKQTCEIGCATTGETVNPFFTPCFYGALFFTAALILSLMLVFMARDKKADQADKDATNKENKI